jgi:hypothetical protein
MPTMVAAAAVSALLGAGCASTQGGSSSSATPEPTVTASAATTTEPTVEPTTAAPTTADDSPARIGPTDAYTWTDGLRVQVTEAKRVVSKQAYLDTERFTSITLQLRNGTKRVFDTSGLDVKLRYGKAGQEAESTFVSAEGYNGLNGNVLPNRVATGRYAFKLPAGTLPITVEVDPGYTPEYDQYTPAFFEGTIK